MTLLAAAGPRPAPPTRSSFLRRHRLLLAVVAVVIAAAGITTWLVLKHEDGKYGPITPGAWGGVYQQRGWESTRPGFGVRLSAAPGAEAQLIEALDNRGSHSVKVTSIERDFAVVRIQWSRYRLGPDDLGTGADTPWHAFPAIIPAHGTIRLLITLHRPRGCPTGPASVVGRIYYGDAYQVHWESLLGSHTTTVQGGYGIDDNIQLC